MRTRQLGSLMLYGLLSFVVVSAGCRHQVAAKPPAPGPPSGTAHRGSGRLAHRGYARPVRHVALVVYERDVSQSHARGR